MQFELNTFIVLNTRLYNVLYSYFINTCTRPTQILPRTPRQALSISEPHELERHFLRLCKHRVEERPTILSSTPTVVILFRLLAWQRRNSSIMFARMPPNGTFVSARLDWDILFPHTKPWLRHQLTDTATSTSCKLRFFFGTPTLHNISNMATWFDSNKFQQEFFAKHFVRPTEYKVKLEHLKQCHFHRHELEQSNSDNSDGPSPSNDTAEHRICTFKKLAVSKKTHIIDFHTSYVFQNVKVQCTANKRGTMYVFGGVKHDHRLPQASRKPEFKLEQSFFLEENPSPLLSLSQSFGVTFQFILELHQLTEVLKKVSSPCMWLLYITSL